MNRNLKFFFQFITNNLIVFDFCLAENIFDIAQYSWAKESTVTRANKTSCWRIDQQTISEWWLLFNWGLFPIHLINSFLLLKIATKLQLQENILCEPQFSYKRVTLSLLIF